MQSDFDKNLLNYFTDVEHLRDAFKASVAAPTLTKHLLVIHGVGGVGKSSLLRMFRLHCKSGHVPAALASGDEAKSALDILYFKSPTGEEHGWVPDLKVAGVRFAKFNATFEHYRAIQAKVDEQAKKAQDTRGRMADIAGKAASKTAETAGGALMGAALGSVIPGIGTAIGGALGGVLGGMGAEALVGWLRGFLAKPDIDLLLDPSKKLTSDFLEDIAKAAEKRRIVVMLDAFEQMTALDDWARDVAQRIHPNVLLAIAGRKLPEWNRTWQDWMAIAQVEELKPMTEEIMGQLIRRYYATMRGGEPDPVQVEAIIRVARGLPIVVTGVVQLWVKYDYDVDDFQSVKTEAIANFVDWLMEGVQSTLIPALEAAAVVRWFDQPILRAVTGLENVRDVYNELRRFPFVRTRVEGLLALHDSVREMMDENLRVQDSERYSELHKRAAMYFEKRLENATGEGRHTASNKDLRDYVIEALYHHLIADEKTGMQLVRATFGAILRQYDLTLCDEIVAMLLSIPNVSEETKLWAKFLELQVIPQRSTWENAFDGLESLLLLDLPTEMEIEARWGLGFALDYRGERERAVKEFTTAFNLSKTMSEQDWSIQAKILTRLGAVQSGLAEFDVAYQTLNEALKLARKTKSQQQIIDTLNEINYLMQKYDRFDEAEPILKEIIRLSEEISDFREQGLAHARLGEYLINKSEFSDEAREHLEKASYLLDKVEDIQSWAWANRNLGLLFMGRNEPQEALRFLEGSCEGYRKRGSSRGLFRTQVVLCECLVELSDFKKIKGLEAEMEQLDKQVALADYSSRWKATQADCQLSDFSGGEDSILQAQKNYIKSLQMAMDYNQCALLFLIADRIAKRIKWLTKNERSNDAEFILNGISQSWLGDRHSDGETFSEVENRRCTPQEGSSVIGRISSGLL